MFEKQVAYYLNKYLGQYVYNVDASALSVSILKGNVELRNLQLKPEALNALNLPITVKSGLLGSLKLTVPWSNLGGAPVVCELEGIYVLAVPNKDAKKSEEEYLAAEQQIKQQKIKEAEEEFIKVWKESLDRKLEATDPAKKGDEEPKTASGLQSFIETILGNLQLSITNVHVRYEDDNSIPGQVFACGVTLEEISAYTVDSSGNRTFVSKNALEHLRKSARLRRLAVYFDVETEQYSPEAGAWEKMARSHWDTLFMPGIRDNSEVPGRQYVFAPIDGDTGYERMGEKQRRVQPASEPSNTTTMFLNLVKVQFDESQFKCVQAMLEAISLHNQRMPHLHLRPLSRPSRGAAALRWWQYAVKASFGGRKSSSQSWKDIAQVCSIRKKYLPLYEAALVKGKVGGTKETLELEKDLDIGTIVMFRKLAFMHHEKKKLLEEKKTAEKKAAEASQTWSGWLGWGSSKAAVSGIAALDVDNMFTSSDMDELNSLMEEAARLREEASKVATPFTVLRYFSIKIGEASVALTDFESVEIVKSAMVDLNVELRMYPKTMDAKVSVGQIIASSADELILTSESSAQAEEGSKIFSMRYIHMPQDGRADHVVDLVTQPTYLTYRSEITDRILAFVQRNQNVKLGGIASKAGAMADNMASNVSKAVSDALANQQAPRLLLNLTMEAPRVALPLKPPPGAKAAAETMVLDFGRFQLQSDNAAHDELPEDEAMVYECIALKGSNVQANLVEGEFSWKRWEAICASGDATSMYSLIEPIEMYCKMQYGKAKHPTLPRLRSKFTLPTLVFHLSPARVSRVMLLLRDLLGLEKAQLRQRAPLWLSEVDFSGDMSMLTWTGTSNASWVEHWGAIWFGWLYVLESEGSYKVVKSISIFNRHALKVPPQMVGGAENAIALATDSRLTKKVIEQQDTVVLRFATAKLASDWLWRLHLAKQRMAAMMPKQMVTDEGLSQLQAMVEANPEEAVRKQESKIFLDATVDIGQMVLVVSGRTRETWWPPEDFIEVEQQRHHFKGESALMSMRGQGMRVDLEISPTHVDIASSLASMLVEDELVGPLKPSGRFLAVSNLAQLDEADANEREGDDSNPQEADDEDKQANLPAAAPPPEPSPTESDKATDVADGAEASDRKEEGEEEQKEEEEEEQFFDAMEDVEVEASSDSMSVKITEMEGLDLGDEAPDAQESSKLAHITFGWKGLNSPLYDGIDTEATMKLSTLYFFFNRPTVAALMAWGVDVGQAFALLNAPARKAEPSDAQDASQPAREDGGIVRGAADRIIFRLKTEMEALQLVLNYEGYDTHPFLEAAMQATTVHLDVLPAALRLDMAIGNLVARDKSFGEAFPYSTLCDLRGDGSGSLIELTYTTHKGGPEPAEGGRVPKHLDYQKLRGKLNAVDIVFLNRQIQEILAYISGLLALQPINVHEADSLDANSSASSFDLARLQRKRSMDLNRSFALSARDEEGKLKKVDCMTLLLDIDLQAPVIVMPLSSFSTDGIQLDLGHALITNCISWHEVHQDVLIDTLSITATGLTANSIIAEERSPRMVCFDEDGFKVSVARTLYGPEGVVPKYSMDVVIPEANVDVKDCEFRLIVAIVSSNLGEELNLPPGVVWVQEHVVPHRLERLRSVRSRIEEEWTEGDLRTGEEEVAPNMKIIVKLQGTHLQLLTTKEGLQGEPLADMTLPCMTVNYQSSPQGMSVAVSIPHLVVQDMRLGMPEKSRIVMSASNSPGAELGSGEMLPSVLALEYLTNALEGTSILNVRMQRPTFIAEMGFLLALSSYVVPQPDDSAGYLNADILLQSEMTAVSEDLWLSPSCRLLADGPACDFYTLDGCGNRIVLPMGITQTEPLPLIIIGAGKTLRLKNFRIVNAKSLPGALQLGQSAELIADEDLDDVVMMGEHDFSAGLESLMRHHSSLKNQASMVMADKPTWKSMTVNLTAAGMSINFLDVELRETDDEETAAASETTSNKGKGWANELSSYMLNTKMDVAMTYTSESSGARMLDADLHDVLMDACLETVDTIAETEDTVHIETENFRMDDGNRVLQPCDITFHYASSKDNTEIKLDSSDMVWTVSIDMLHALSRLHTRVLGPLFKPPMDRPLAAASSFTKVWPTKQDNATGMPPYPNPRAVDLFVAERSFAVWRPKPPSGYVSLGDVITQGGAAPRQSPVCLAKDFQVTSLPSSYEEVHHENDLWIWRPIPPSGFVALGCVCTTTAEPPQGGEVYCVREQLAVPAAPAECLFIRTRSPSFESLDGGNRREQVRLWAVANSPATFTAVVTDDDLAGVVPAGICLDLRSPLGIMPGALRQSLLETFKAQGKLKDMSLRVLRETIHLPEEEEAQMSKPEDLEQAPVVEPVVPEPSGDDPEPSSIELLSYNSELLMHMAHQFVQSDVTLRKQRTTDQARIEVAEFQRLCTHDTGKKKVTFWRPVLPPGYIALGDCMSLGVHPPTVVTVFRDFRDDFRYFEKGEDKGPIFSRPVSFQRTWESAGPNSDRVSLWRPIPPNGYEALGWIVWKGRTIPSRESATIRCIRSDLIQLTFEKERPSDVLVWSRSVGRPPSSAPLSQQQDLSLWVTNMYTGTFMGMQELSHFFTWESPLMYDDYSNKLHAERTENPHYKVSLDTGLLSIVLMDLHRTPLVELNLGGSDSLQGRNVSWTKHGRHTKRDGCRVHLIESAPGLLQAFSQLSGELWSYQYNHWEPVMEPFGLLVHVDHNSRARMVKNFRPGTHLGFKSTSEGLHLTFAHSALDSILRAVNDAKAMLQGDNSGVLQSAQTNARYAYVQNALGVEIQSQISYGKQIATQTTAPNQTHSFVMPRAVTYRRKRPEPTSIPKGTLLVDVSHLQTDPGVSSCPGALSLGVALVPGHELDQHMPIQTRWVQCRAQDGGASGGSTQCVAEWKERLVLCIPDESVMGIARALKDRERSDGGAESLVMQVVATDIKAANERGAVVATGMLEITGKWLLDQIWAGHASGSLSEAVELNPVGSPQTVFGHVGVTVQLEWVSWAASGLPADASPDKEGSDLNLMSSVKIRLNEDDNWSPMAMINSVRRGAGDSSATIGSGTPQLDTAQHASNPTIVTPVVLQAGDKRQGIALEEVIEQGIRKFTARSLCQVTNHTSVTLEVGLVIPEGAAATSPDTDDGFQSQAFGKKIRSETQDGELRVSVVETIYENQRFQLFRGFGGVEFLTPEDEAEGHKQYEWLDNNGEWKSDYRFPAMALPKDWKWLDNWTVSKDEGQAEEGFIYGMSFDELTFPPQPGTDNMIGKMVRRRAWNRTRMQVAAVAGQNNGGENGIQILGRVAPRERIPLPLGWNARNTMVVLRPVMEPQEGASDHHATSAQMGSISHNWSICMLENSSGIPLDSLKDGTTYSVACPPCEDRTGAVQLIAPNRNLRKFTAFEGLIFWMSARVVSNTFPTEGLLDWEVVISPPLLLENLLPVGTEFKLWEKGRGQLKIRCEGSLDSGGVVQVHSVDMSKEVYITLKPDGCRTADDAPVLLFSNNCQAVLPSSIDFGHTSHNCKPTIPLFLERRMAGQVLDQADQAARSSVALGSPMAVSLFAGLVVLNTTQLPVYVSLERSFRPRKRMEKQKAKQVQENMGNMGNLEPTLKVMETSAAYYQSMEGCKILPGTANMMSYPFQSEYEYNVKVAMEGSSWAPAVPLDSDMPNEDLLLRAHIGGTQQIHESVVSVQTCTGAFGRSKLLKLEPHIIISNLTGLPLQLLQCLPPTQVESKGKLRKAKASKSVGSSRASSRSAKRESKQALDGRRPTPLAKFISRVSNNDEKQPKKEKKEKSNPFKAIKSLMEEAQETPMAGLLSAGLPPLGPSGHSSMQRLAIKDQPEEVEVEVDDFAEWPTDTLGMVELPPGSAAVPMYWTENCWRKSLCVRLLDQKGDPYKAPTSSPLRLEHPGFEEVLLRLPVSHAEDATGAPPDAPISNFFRNSRTESATRMRGALAGSPFLYTTGPGSEPHECFSDREALVVRVSASLKRNSCLHLVFHSVNTEAPNVVENRSPHNMLFRKAGSYGAQWQLARPWSSVPVAWDTIQKEQRKIDLMELSGLHQPGRFNRYSMGRRAGKGGSPSASSDDMALHDNGDDLQSFPSDFGNSEASGSNRGADSWAMVSQEFQTGALTSLRTESGEPCNVQLLPAALTPHPLAGGGVLVGYSLVGGRAVGLCTRTGSLLVTASAADNSNGVASAGSLQNLPPRIYISFKLNTVDVSIVDHTPQELVLFSADDIQLHHSIGLGPQNTFMHTHLKVMTFQVDNMLPYTPYPILLCPAKHKDDDEKQPLLEVVLCNEPSSTLGNVYYPYIYVAFSQTLALSICEELLWDLVAMYNNLSLPPKEGQSPSSVVQADTGVDIRLLTVPDLRTRLSLGTSPEARADSGLGGQYGYLFTLAAFNDLSFNIDRWERCNINMPRSVFMQNLYNMLTNYVFGLAFRILRSNVSLASASRAIGGVSGQVAKLSMDDEFKEIRDQQNSTASNLGEGVREGGEALAKGLAWGITGVVRRPLMGAQKAGAAGFFQGLGQGFVGAVTQPMSGVMDFVAKTAEGAGASIDQTFKNITGDELDKPEQRRRDPRSISGDKWLQPFNQQAASGQLLMWQAKRAPGLDEIVNMKFRPVNIGRNRSDKYEAHLLLPNSKFAFITNCRVMMLSMPNGSSSGSPSGSNHGSGKTKSPVLEWECEWEDVLNVQLKRSRGRPSAEVPDCVEVYRKLGTDEGVMQHRWRCQPNSAQAEQLAAMIMSARMKYSDTYRSKRATEPLTPILSSSQSVLSRLDAVDASAPSGLVEWTQGPWRLLWRSYGSSTVSIWRPQPMAGYAALGDVLIDGPNPPQLPVAVIREHMLPKDAETVRKSGKRLKVDKPAVAHPTGYHLIWRNSGSGRAPSLVAKGEGPLSVWWPVAPEGYRSLGCMAVPALEEPPLTLAWCVRSDLLQPAELEGSPMWKGMALDRTSWRCLLYRIHNTATRTFYASRPDSTVTVKMWRLAGDMWPGTY